MRISPGQATAPTSLLVAECELKAFRHVVAVVNRKAGATIREVDNGAGDRFLLRQYPHILCDLRASYSPTFTHTLPLTRPRGSISEFAKGL
jgi:hypothetical protein